MFTNFKGSAKYDFLNRPTNLLIFFRTAQARMLTIDIQHFTRIFQLFKRYKIKLIKQTYFRIIEINKVCESHTVQRMENQKIAKGR